jgi:D-amino-acid dehydrogenase
LLDRGEDVEVVEARESVALETSFANGGLHTPSMSEPWNSPGMARHLAASLFDPLSSMKLRLTAVPSLLFWGLKFLRNSSAERFCAASENNFRLASYSLQKTLQATDRFGLAYELAGGGTLSVFRDARSFEMRRAIAGRLGALGMEWHELSADDVVQHEPTLAAIRSQVVAGIWYPDDVRGDAYRFCRELERTILDDGGKVHTSMTVSRLLETRGIISGVETNRGVIKADKVVVAAGVHSPQLLKTVGENVPVKPAKGYSVTIDVTGMTGVPAIPVHDDAMHAAVTPIGSRMRLVGTAEFAGFDKRLDPARVDNLFRLLEAVLPDIYRQVERRDSTPWTNLRPMSYDGCPFIGSAARLSGLFVNTGHGSLGWTMAMGSGELLADLVLGKSPEVDPRPFAFPRTRTSGPRRRSTIAF